MDVLFYISAAVAVGATLLAVTRANAVHGLLYLVVSFFALAVVLFLLGAPFAAALQVIVYAGAIMVLFLFVLMMLDLGKVGVAEERRLLRPLVWVGPSALCLVLLAELSYLLVLPGAPAGGATVGPKEVGAALMGPYLIGVELSGVLLLAGLVAAYHVGRRDGAEGGESVRRSAPGLPRVPHDSPAHGEAHDS